MKKWEKNLIAKLSKNGRTKTNGNRGIAVGSDIHLASMAYDELIKVRKMVAAVFDAPAGSESVDSEEYSAALEALREYDELNPQE